MRRHALITIAILACILSLASAQPAKNRSCAHGPECTVCQLCCVGIRCWRTVSSA